MADIKPTPADPLVNALRIALKAQCQPYEESAQYLAIDDHIDLPLLAVALRGALIGAGKGEMLKPAVTSEMVGRALVAWYKDWIDGPPEQDERSAMRAALEAACA